MMELDLLEVKYLPADLEPGFLYVSNEFNVAGHLCPCGCGNKIITPFGPTEWSISITDNKATLYPSIGNWQLPCQSHYWIRNGRVEWSYQWSKKQIIKGREVEEKNKADYYKQLSDKRKKRSLLRRLIDWFQGK